MEKICGIYIIRNDINGKHYVGQSVDIYTRLSRHKSDLRHNRHSNTHLQSAFNKYGEGAFSFVTLQECEENSLDLLEIRYIDELHSLDSGYNKVPGGNQVKHLLDETKRKLSISHKGKIVSKETREKLSKIKKGLPSPLKGRTLSKEHREKLCLARKGKVGYWKGKSHPSKGKPSKLKGIPKSDETRRRMSESRKEIWKKIKNI